MTGPTMTEAIENWVLRMDLADHAHKLAARLAGFDYIEEKYLAFGALAAQKVVRPDAPEELEEVVDFG